MGGSSGHSCQTREDRLDAGAVGPKVPESGRFGRHRDRGAGSTGVHHAPRAHRHLRHGRLDALAGVGRRDARCSRPAGTRSTRPWPPGSRCTVVEPHLNGPGGDAPIIGYRGSDGHTFVVCGQGTAPAAATIERVPRTSASTSCPGTGHLAAVVPGAFGAWLDLLARYGTLPLADVLAPAIGYARDGYPLVRGRVPHDRDGRRPVHRALADVRGGRTCRTAGRPPRAPGSATRRWRTRSSGCSPGRRPADPRGADRGRAAGVLRGLRRRGRRRLPSGVAVQDSSGRRAHRACSRAADLAAWRATEEPTTSLPVRRPDGPQDRRLGAGTGAPAAAGDARGLDVGSTGAVPRHARARAHRRRGGQARVRRPRGLVRRRPPTSRSTTLLSPDVRGRARAARRPARPPRACCPGRPTGACPRVAASLWGSRAGSAPGRRASPPSRPSGSAPATPATSTSSTAGATGSPRPRRAAGCSPARSCPASGSRCRRARRCSGWSRDCPTAWLRASGRGPPSVPALVLDDDGAGIAFGTPGGDQQDQWTVPFLLRHLLGGAGPAGRDRRPHVALDARAQLVLPAHPHAARAGRRVAARRRRARRASRSAGTRWRRSGRGSSGG